MGPRITAVTSLGAALVFCCFSGCAPTASRQQMADQVGKHDGTFFGNRVLYQGDRDGYRYVRVRSLYSWVGDREYKIQASQWALDRPMKYTTNPLHWQDVTWMDGQAPGFPQNAFVYLTPSFPEGAPPPQPATVPPSTQFLMPDTMPANPSTTQPETRESGGR